MPQSKEFLRVSQARARLVMDHPFFAHLALKLKVIEDPDIGTLATDGRSLRYNPALTATFSNAQLLTAVAHEALHCGLEHPMRLGTRDHRLANVAMDHVVNLILADAGFQPVPPD